MTSTDHVSPCLPLASSECGFPREYLIPNQPTNSLQCAIDSDQPLDFSTKKGRSHNKLSSILEAQDQSFNDTQVQARTAVQLQTKSLGPSTAKPERNHMMIQSSYSQSNDERKLMEQFPSKTDQSASLTNLLESEISPSDINMTTPLGLSNSTVQYKKTNTFSRQSRIYPNNLTSVSSTQGHYNYPFHSPLTTDHKLFLSDDPEQAYLQFREQALKIHNMQDCHRSSFRPQNRGQVNNFEAKSCWQSECSATAPNSEAINTNTDSSEVIRTETVTYSMFASSITTGTTATATGTNSTPDISLDRMNNSKSKATNYTGSSDSGPSTTTEPLNQSSFRKRSRSLTEEQKDDTYWERRRKNNEAAKRSRNARRAKEYEIAIRAAYLEQENLKLRIEVASLKNETVKLRCLLYNS
ncbi:uncharacterized protein LOC143229732 isoform X2 [Tachypleus tridentatus]